MTHNLLACGFAAALALLFLGAIPFVPDESENTLAADFAPLLRWLRRGKRRLPQSLRRPRSERGNPRPAGRHARRAAAA